MLFDLEQSQYQDYSLSDLPKPGKLKAFSIFCCGGGSSIGYKMAGIDVLGGCELDPRIADIYKKNLKPKLFINADAREILTMDLPDELYNLDILDGSPPCTPFSVIGSREKSWGKKKKFAEGQKLQTLDDLVEVYWRIVLRLKPKVAVMENVNGLAFGAASNYINNIYRLIGDEYTLHFRQYNAKFMGCPQSRGRIFIIGIRADLKKFSIAQSYHEPPIPYSAIADYGDTSDTLSPCRRSAWHEITHGPCGPFDAIKKVSLDKPCPVICATNRHVSCIRPRFLNDEELRKASTFPSDYDFTSSGKCQFITGMCVPPKMMYRIALNIKQGLEQAE